MCASSTMEHNYFNTTICLNILLPCYKCYVVSDECDECDEPTSCLVQPIVAHCREVMYFRCFDFRGELGFLNCDDICICVVNKQFKPVYVDLQYDEISLQDQNQH